MGVVKEITGFGGRVVGEVKVHSKTQVSGYVPSSRSVTGGSISSSTSTTTQFFVETKNGKQREVVVPGMLGVATDHVVGVAEVRGVVTAIANGTTDKTIWWPGQAKKAVKRKDYSPIGILPYFFLMVILGLFLFAIYPRDGIFSVTVPATPEAIQCAQPFVEKVTTIENQVIAEAEGAGLRVSKSAPWDNSALSRVIVIAPYFGRDVSDSLSRHIIADSGLISALENKPEHGALEFSGPNSYEFSSRRYREPIRLLSLEYRNECKTIYEARSKKLSDRLNFMYEAPSIGGLFILVSSFILLVFNTVRRGGLKRKVIKQSKNIAEESIP